MEKRYQVFVSSTYEDLRVERQAVIHALLELDCIPAGMELFPAADDDQWSLIKSVIDDCDYYVLILAGRYGSLGADGLGYTEKEYKYALESKKPIAAFIHKDPTQIPNGKCEKTTEGIQKLNEFRELVQKKLCKTWSTADELAGVVSRSMLHLIRRNPATGWVRADVIADAKGVLKLKQRIDELEAQVVAFAEAPPTGVEGLAQGDDEFCLEVAYESSAPNERHIFTRTWYKTEYYVTWNEIFRSIAPCMINEATQGEMRDAIDDYIEEDYKRTCAIEGETILRVETRGDFFDTIVVQLRALGLIQKSTKNRSVKDTAAYWTLTPYGDRRLTELRAIKKSELPEEKSEYSYHTIIPPRDKK